MMRSSRVGRGVSAGGGASKEVVLNTTKSTSSIFASLIYNFMTIVKIINKLYALLILINNKKNLINFKIEIIISLAIILNAIIL